MADIMSNHLHSTDNSICTDSNNSDENNKLNKTVEELDKNGYIGEVIETVSNGDIENNIQILKFNNNVGQLVNNTTDQTIKSISFTNEPVKYDSDESDISQKPVRLKKKKFMQLADSDSEDLPFAAPLINIDNGDNENNIFEPIIEGGKKKRHRRLAIVDSDSDIDNEVITGHNTSLSNEALNNKEQVIFTANSKGELIPEASDDNFKVQKSILSTLCDPESSDEEVGKEYIVEEYNIDKEEIKPKSYKKKSKPKRGEEENPKQMTGKEAAELRKEIKSESQRMVREMNVSLPYHKPKSYTLKEFLARRPKLVSAAPSSAKTPASVAIKMSTEQLKVITQKLKEREKEVKEFYRSESESEENDSDEDYIPPTQKNDDHNSKNIEHTDSGIDLPSDLHEMSNILKDDSNETNLINLISIEKDSAVEQKIADQILEEIVICEESNIDSRSLFYSKDCITDSNVRENLNDGTAECPKETEKEIINSEPVIESNTTSEIPKVLNIKDFSEEVNDSLTVVESNTASEVVNAVLNAEESSEKEINCLEAVVAVDSNLSPEVIQAVLNTEDSSTGYEFNLDDLEENSERLIIEKYTSNLNDITEKPSSRFEYTDLDREIENFCPNDEKTNESAIAAPKLSKLELIKERITNIKPKLTGGPDNIIDLETGVAKPNDVTRLMERFAQHNLKKHTHKNKVKLSIVSIESGEIHKETVAVHVEEEDNPLAIEERPGAKLQKLRDELQNQIAQKRSEFWQKKKKVTSGEEITTYEGEKEECGMDEDILDDEEEEAEMTDLSEDEEYVDSEEEGREDRVVERKKSLFIDEEAEESDRDDEAIEADNEDGIDADNEDGNDADNEDGIDADIESEDVPESGLNEDENSKSSDVPEKLGEKPVKKNLRRIIKGFVEDSDDDDDNETTDLVLNSVGTSGHEKEHLNNIVNRDDEYFLPPHQPQSSQSPVKSITQDKSQFDFPTPVSYITGLQNLNNSSSKSLKGSPVLSLFQPTNVPSPLKENNWHQSLQKKLFTDSDITDSQIEEIAKFSTETSSDIQDNNETKTVNEEELVKICSGTFPSTLRDKGNETQLAELCSGVFPSTADEDKHGLSPDELPSTKDLLNICSGKFTGETQNENTREAAIKPTATYRFNMNKEMTSLDADQDMIISQLIDEDEMEKFKKKFDSPLLSNTQKRIVEEFEEVVGSGGVIDSDDEDELIEVKKKKQKRLMFSDDEDSDQDEKEEEVIDLHDDVGSECDEDAVNDVAADNIGYDSEENEIELVEDRVGPKLKPSDFFENEAELSESEWGSADEDEKDLDTMEFELGDEEKFDEKKIRSDLEKIHMRRLLDDDTREVKMLQELLLEDGEMHGTGRERQFKWKNIDSMDDGNEERKDEDDVYLDEEESEEQWRKRRYEREMFFKEKQKKLQQSEDDDLLSESQLLKIGHKVIQRSQTNSQGSSASLEKTNVTPGSPDVKQPFSLMNKRGSFLSRSDHVLQRLAEYAKDTSAVAQGSAKNSRKFLFQTVSVEETSISITNQDKKRKATDGTPKELKKLRLSNNFSPVGSKKNSDKSAKAKLFGNW